MNKSFIYLFDKVCQYQNYTFGKFIFCMRLKKNFFIHVGKANITLFSRLFSTQDLRERENDTC